MAGTGATPAAFYLGLCRLRDIQSPPASATASCRRAVLHRHDDCAASIRKSGPEIKNRCSLWAVLKGFFTSIPKSEPEIKNRCTQEGVNGEKHASIPKFGLEIKNRCTQEGVNGEKHASILKFGLEIKNRCMKQHIPRHAFYRAPKHASCLGCYLHGAGSSWLDSGGESGC